MKRSILITAFFAIATGTHAHSGGNGTPKEVTSPGSNPEYPVIRNCRTPEQVAVTLRNYGAPGKSGPAHLSAALTNIGFTNGAQDLTAENITPANLPAGTISDMGSGSCGTSYMTLNTDGGNGTKAWKIPAPGGQAVYFPGRCGNTFNPKKEGSLSYCAREPYRRH
jgi:hypothetical protein